MLAPPLSIFSTSPARQFKSQSIDTPGVIERVSTLFRGHPSLIQGFNTFLPPGYRIECSMDPSESNLITVTTPSGTTTQKEGAKGIAGAVRQRADQAAASANAALAGQQSGAAENSALPSSSSLAATTAAAQAPRLPQGSLAGIQQQAMGSAPSASRAGSPPQPSALGQGSAPGLSPATPGAAAGAGVLSQSNAQSQGPPAQQQAPPPPTPSSAAPGSARSSSERPPLEFNHAINYVNKIKQRYSGEPERYKQFLEILQTYQKEGRAIQDVYAQVTVLFEGDQDLLDEFKQFLPDTSTRPEADDSTDGKGEGSSQRGNKAGGGSARGKKRDAGGATKGAGGASGSGQQAGGPGRGKKSKHNHKAQQERLSPPPMPQLMPLEQAAATYGLSAIAVQQLAAAYGGSDAMIPVEAAATAAANGGAMGPSGMNSAGIPLGPAYAPLATLDEVAFFDRVKKHIDDRAAYLEFLKLLNLFTQDIIDVRTLVDKAAAFIGGHRDLFATFKSLCGYEMGRHGWLEEEEAVIENTPALERPRIDLSTCELYGASYRRLPKEEVNLACSGRDPMCWDVLNDEWVSHPTWASEGEGFNPHKKNIYEDALYRSEEERHEYDYHIEANLRTIALLEPIAARIAAMDEEARATFRLKPGLGGQSRSIYQRVLRKIYGRDAGAEIVAALHDSPATSIPVVLTRLRQKDEEWKRAQREWNKVWRVVDERNWWKSLDHRGVTWKTFDKKAITSRGLVGEIELRRAEDVSRRWMKELGAPRSVLGTELGASSKAAGSSKTPALPSGPWHLEYDFSDKSLIFDAIKLALSHLDRGPSYSRSDIDRIEIFIRSFLPLLMGQDAKQWEEEMGLEPVVGEDGVEYGSINVGEEGALASSSASGEKGRKHDDLRMRVLRGQVASGAATGGAPATSSTAADGDSEMRDASGLAAADGSSSTMEQTWISADTRDAFDSTKPTATGDSAESTPAGAAPAGLQTLNFFCSTSHYTFLRLFQLIYTRLGKMKRLSAELGEEIDDKNDKRKSRGQKPSVIRGNPLAIRLGLQDKFAGVGGVVGGANAVLDAEAAAVAEEEAAADKANGSANGTSGPTLPPAPVSGWELHPSKYYSVLLELIEKLLDGDSMDQNMFEECVRFMFGIEGYVVFTIDKVLGALVKCVQGIVNENKSTELARLLEKDRVAHLARQQQAATATTSSSERGPERRSAQASAYRQQIATRMSAEVLIGKDEHLFRIGWTPANGHLGMQMLSRDDPSADLPTSIGLGLDGAATDFEGEDEKRKEERWLYYVASYGLWAPTEGLMGEAKGPFLKRSVAKGQKSAAVASPTAATPAKKASTSDKEHGAPADGKEGSSTESNAIGAVDPSGTPVVTTTSPGSGSKPPAENAASNDYVVKNVLESGLEIKVCMSSYRLFFVTDTSDTFARVRLLGDEYDRRTLLEQDQRNKREQKRKSKFQAWIEKKASGEEQQGKDAAAEAEAAAEGVTASKTLVSDAEQPSAKGDEQSMDVDPVAAAAVVESEAPAEQPQAAVPEESNVTAV